MSTNNNYEQARIEKECMELRKIINESKISLQSSNKGTAVRIIDEYSEWQQNYCKNNRKNELEGTFDFDYFNYGNYSELYLRYKKEAKIAEWKIYISMAQIDMLAAANNSLESNRRLTKNDESQVKKLSVEDLNKLSKEELIDDIKKHQVKCDSLNQNFDLFLQVQMQEEFELQKQELQNQINPFCEHFAIKQEIQKKDEKIIDLHSQSFKLIKDIERIQADVVDAVKIEEEKIVNMTKQTDEFL
ncbi:2020_t:CDS:2 [Ambispora leptoticha]|uniref:2020_t:CDS:1 n=1 Tax=Ambispora leptoticha TaxID=144679 RepID=A0A9N9CJZ6_9GLOM|nr:2020_t:CDS:2 [Ambispora leptoticha]